MYGILPISGNSSKLHCRNFVGNPDHNDDLLNNKKLTKTARFCIPDAVDGRSNWWSEVYSPPVITSIIREQLHIIVRIIRSCWWQNCDLFNKKRIYSIQAFSLAHGYCYFGICSKFTFSRHGGPQLSNAAFWHKIVKNRELTKLFFIPLPLQVGLYRKAQISDFANHRLCLWQINKTQSLVYLTRNKVTDLHEWC